MTLYGTFLFVHVVFAIALVGGSAWAHVVLAQARRAPTTEVLTGQLGYLHAFVKASMPIAVVTVLAGLYLTFAGDWWGEGWPVVSLVIFSLAGAAAGGVVDPGVARIADAVAASPSGPLTADVHAAIHDRRLAMVTWLMAGADLAIVAMMTNKPAWAGSLVLAALGLGLGAVFGAREGRGQVAAEVSPG